MGILIIALLHAIDRLPTSSLGRKAGHDTGEYTRASFANRFHVAKLRFYGNQPPNTGADQLGTEMALRKARRATSHFLRQ